MRHMDQHCQLTMSALTTDLYYFIQILYESYVHHVTADKLVNIPTEMAASSVEWC